MDKENMNILMETFIKENFMMEKCKGKAFINGLMKKPLKELL
jgi:hypothetical protein